MNNTQILAHQKQMMQWRQTQLGELFERFVSLHARAWQLDERSHDGYGERAAERAWQELYPVQEQLRKQLMQIAGIDP
jgi:hypothetical protein